MLFAHYITVVANYNGGRNKKKGTTVKLFKPFKINDLKTKIND